MLKCNTCGNTLTTAERSIDILICMPAYITNKLPKGAVKEKIKRPYASCQVCILKLKKQIKNKDSNEKELKKLRKLRFLSEEQKKQKNSLEQSIKKQNRSNQNINTALKNQVPIELRRKIKKQQGWFYKEYSGEHLKNKLKDLMCLKENKEETESFLGDATKFLLESVKGDKKFLVKYSKDSEYRNNHGAKEIITELIMTDIASYFMKSAKCSIVFYAKQLAICSTLFTYFGKNTKYNYRAIHGKEIFEHLKRRTPPNKRRLQRDFYALEEIEESLKKYPKNIYIDNSLIESKSLSLLSDFRYMLLIDCFLGHQDRHHENWCLILKTPKTPQDLEKELYFSPLFDTGRGLLWNENIYELIYKYGEKKNLKRYMEQSKPLFHLKEHTKATHFDIAKYISNQDKALYMRFSSRLRDFPVKNFLDSYTGLISPIRIVRMKEILKYRKLRLLEV